jgi:hypothetical protein
MFYTESRLRSSASVLMSQVYETFDFHPPFDRMTLHLLEPSYPTTCLLLMLPLTACSITNTLRGSLALGGILSVPLHGDNIAVR